MTAAIYHTLLRVALENYSNNRCTSGKMQGHHHSLDTRASKKPEIQNYPITTLPMLTINLKRVASVLNVIYNLRINGMYIFHWRYLLAK